MVIIDGSSHSGSGTILRYALSLCTLTGDTLRMTNIRAGRKKPGLRPQHLSAVKACAEFCRGQFSSVDVGSREMTFTPGGVLAGGSYSWNIGTAGSTTLLAYSTIPLALFADSTTKIRLQGGVFQDFAPSAYHMADVLFPLLAYMGATVSLEVERPGYPPKGGGRVELKVAPMKGKLSPVKLPFQGKINQVRIRAIASHLGTQKVAERMAASFSSPWGQRSNRVTTTIVNDTSALQAGAALSAIAATDTGCLLGADMAGRPGRRSESIGQRVARQLAEDLNSGATVDRHLADMLILFCALADGESIYVIPHMTEHIETNLWLTTTILGAEYRIEGNTIRINGIGYCR
jgi:RNA 3'-terminal phosphate cyclase (ATP)